MTTKEKIELLDSFDSIPKLTYDHFQLLKRFTFDRNAFVRSRVPIYLLEFIDEASKDLMIVLSKDRDELVRAEAYDSLGSFPFESAENRLREAITNENDLLARSYAIVSWVNVVVLNNTITEEKRKFIESELANETDECCALNFCYGAYRFGDGSYLNRVLSFLNSENYHVRCSTLNLLSEILNDKNSVTIKMAIKDMLNRETAASVTASARKLLGEIR